MLGIYKSLFKQLNMEVPYVVWKACHALHAALNGHGDIDLLVDLQCRDQFQRHLRDHGFARAWYTSLNFPFVEHYYGYDEETGGMGHLHVYYKMVTGESHVKSYQLPLEKEVIANRFLNSEGVYEAAYSDQAFIYTIRHYMKRSSLFGFLLWAYEHRDYHEEYGYIKGGLESLGESISIDEKISYEKEVDFDKIDLGTNVSGYWEARRKKPVFDRYRRFGRGKALLMNLYYFVLRLYFRAFRVKKKIETGRVIAVSGVDGSGKSSMVQELQSWFGKNFHIKVMHLGRPSPTIITFPLRPALFIYRLLRGGNENDKSVDNDTPRFSLTYNKGFVWAVRYLALAYERFALARRAEKLAGKGAIVVCDRYPTLSPGKMDSPRISSGGSKLVEWMRQGELYFYKHVPKADALIFLDVSEGVAITRNRGRIKEDKESDEGISRRHQENQGLDYCAKRMFVIDADCDYEIVLQSVKSMAWEFISHDQIKSC